MFTTRKAGRAGRRTLGPVLVSTLAVSSMFLLAACSSGGSNNSSATTGTSARSTSLVIAENEVPASFDPVQADNSTVDEVTLPTYDSLVAYNSANKLAGDLASSWTIASNGLSIAVTLHSGVTFHDGTALTAKDVAYTLDRIKKINIGVASFLTAYKSTTVTDDTHLTINLSAPDATFVPSLTRVYIVNSALVTKNAGSDSGQAWLATHDAGSGPYELVKYTSNQAADFKEYPKYWKGFTGQAKTVEFRYLADSATESSALKSGDVDIAMDIAPAEYASYQKNSSFTVDEAKTNVGLYAFFNMNGASTKNKALREAVAYSYDYKQHVDSILKGAGTQLDGILPSGFGVPTTGLTQPKLDLAKAKELVASNNLKGTTLTLTYFKATTEMEQAATLLQSNLAEIGITLKVEAVTYPAYVTMAAKASTRPDIALVYAFPAYPDPSAVLYQNFDSKFVGGGQNWGAYDNAQVNTLVEEAQVSTDPATRTADYLKAEQLITADYATINMANAKYVTVYDKKVQGYIYRPAHHQTVDVYAITLKK